VDGQTFAAPTDDAGYATVRVPASIGQELTITTRFTGHQLYTPSEDTDQLTVLPAFAQGLSRGDIVFLIDESGSMHEDQEEVAQRLSDIVELLGAEIDFRLGLVGFGSGVNGGHPHVLTPMTDDVATFALGLEALVASGGAEPGFSAVVMGMDADRMGFRNDASVCAILITDDNATPHIRPITPETQADALTALASRGAVFLGIVNTHDKQTAFDYGPAPGSLSFETGGQVFDILDFRNDSLPVLNAILDDCTRRINLEALPDLVISKETEQPTAQTGDLIDYTITITNASTQEATGVSLIDTLPDDTVFVSASQGGTVSAGEVRWPLFSLPARTSVTRKITLRVDDTRPKGAHTITNTVSVFDDGVRGDDLTPENNKDSTTTRIEMEALVTATPTATPTPTDWLLVDSSQIDCLLFLHRTLHSD
jgi:uncharacterized repeat protein (TIGR01451 family)